MTLLYLRFTTMLQIIIVALCNSISVVTRTDHRPSCSRSAPQNNFRCELRINTLIRIHSHVITANTSANNDERSNYTTTAPNDDKPTKAAAGLRKSNAYLFVRGRKPVHRDGTAETLTVHAPRNDVERINWKTRVGLFVRMSLNAFRRGVENMSAVRRQVRQVMPSVISLSVSPSMALLIPSRTVRMFSSCSSYLMLLARESRSHNSRRQLYSCRRYAIFSFSIGAFLQQDGRGEDDDDDDELDA